MYDAGHGKSGSTFRPVALVKFHSECVEVLRDPHSELK
jgi:hypothetical protein